jgi:hypothetical protein
MTPQKINRDAMPLRHIHSRPAAIQPSSLKNNIRLFLVILVAGSFFCGKVAAEDWRFSAAIYGWGPDTQIGVDTPFGQIDGEISVADVLDALDLAFMGAVTAEHGRLGFTLDTMFVKLSDNTTTPGVAGFTNAAVESQVSITNVYVTWAVLQNPSRQLDVGAGARAYNTSTDVTFSGGTRPALAGVSDDWIDPVVAVRFRTELGQYWYGTLFADIGGFGTGSESTWQGLAALGYSFTESFSVEGGYRILQSDRIESNGEIDIEMSGLVFGTRWRF